MCFVLLFRNGKRGGRGSQEEDTWSDNVHIQLRKKLPVNPNITL